MTIVAYMRENTPAETVKIAENQCVEKQNENNGIVSSTFVTESTHSNPPDVVMHCPKVSKPKKTIFDDIVECFSLRKNIQTLTSVDKPANAVPIIDGLK